MLRNYQLYIIEDEFANHYFGREKMFYQLFLDYSKSTNERRVILKKQINYITKPVPSFEVESAIKKDLSKRLDFSYDNSSFYIKVNEYSYAKLTIFERYIHIEAAGSFESEAVFFEVLRKWEQFYLAIDLKNNRYGWLKPHKERKFLMKNIKQILYNDLSFSTL